MQGMADYYLQLEDLQIHVVHKTMKNMYLRVKTVDGPVEVSAPIGVKKVEILRFVATRQDWIEEARVRLKQKQEQKKEEPMLVPFQERERKQKLRRQIADYIRAYEPLMGVSSQGFTIKKMKTRWGSCNVKTHHLNFNFALTFQPDELIEYVVVHELTHLLEPSHNARFWALMELYLPGAKERRKKLNSGHNTKGEEDE